VKWALLFFLKIPCHILVTAFKTVVGGLNPTTDVIDPVNSDGCTRSKVCNRLFCIFVRAPESHALTCMLHCHDRRDLAMVSWPRGLSKRWVPLSLGLFSIIVELPRLGPCSLGKGILYINKTDGMELHNRAMAWLSSKSGTFLQAITLWQCGMMPS
jgi:hypothetical protein